MSRVPKVPVYRDDKKIKIKPQKKQVKKRVVDPATLKKKQQLIMELQKKLRDIEQCINKAEYKKAYKIAKGPIEKYTSSSFKTDPTLERISLLAETAIEYLAELTSEGDDNLLEFLASEMEDYKDLDIFRTIEKVFVQRIEFKLGELKEKGKEAYMIEFVNSWKPWVILVDGEKQIEQFNAGDLKKWKWKFKFPIEFAPGEKQEALEFRKKIYKYLNDKLGEEDVLTGDDQAQDEPEVVDPSTLLGSPPIQVIKPKSKSSGYFSSKKSTTSSEKDQPKAPKRTGPSKAKTQRLKLEAKEDERLRSSEIREYLKKLKYEEGENEVHFLKIKNALGIVTQNKEKKLFKMLERLCEKGYLVRKRGSRYAILF
ncbi:MAG: hypothetical protein ACFFCS_01085 [Candidatus Hodarchaeota archaeon]